MEEGVAARIEGIGNTCGQNDDTSSILDYVCTMGNFDLSCQAFTKAGLAGLLGGITALQEDAIITVYTPTNDAMEAAGYSAEYIENSMSASQLESLMNAHIIRGSVTVDQLVCDEHQITFLGVASIKIECPVTNIDGSTSKTVAGFFNNDSNTPTILPPTDIALCNGLVQPISQVIFVTTP